MQQPKIAMCYDVPDWAFHNICRNISVVTDGFEFDLYSKKDWFKTPVADEIAQKADVIVFLWRFDALAFLDSLSEASWDKMCGPDRPSLITMIYDHLYQDEASLEKIGNPFHVSDVICASSERLQRIYEEEPHLPSVHYTLADGVNLDRFPTKQKSSVDEPLRIGWVGNSEWGQKYGTDLKGRRTIFDPAIATLKAQALNFETRIADRAEKRVAYEDMPDFYGNLDILVCTSAIEGTPNPVLEAMASGAAIVSTDVGIVPEVLGPRQSEFILDREPDVFSTALGRIIEDRGLFAELCSENIARREFITWESRGPLWKASFEAALNRPDKGNGPQTAALKRYRIAPWRNVSHKMPA